MIIKQKRRQQPKIRLVVLEVSSWVGSIGAEHYYGKLKMDDRKDVKVQTKLTSKEALHLTKKDRRFGTDYRYRKGQLTTRFSDAEKVEEEAKRVWRKHFPKAHALVVGQDAVADPQRPLDGDPEILKKLKDYWDRFEATGRYEGDAKAAGKVSDEYWNWIWGK